MQRNLKDIKHGDRYLDRATMISLVVLLNDGEKIASIDVIEHDPNEGKIVDGVEVKVVPPQVRPHWRVAYDHGVETRVDLTQIREGKEDAPESERDRFVYLPPRR